MARLHGFLRHTKRTLVLSHSAQHSFLARQRLVTTGLLMGFLIVAIRLFYWQIIMGPSLSLAALNQYERAVTSAGNRGVIYSIDGHALVTNQVVYRLFFEPPLFAHTPQVVAPQIANILTTALPEDIRLDKRKEWEDLLLTRLTTQDKKWVSLAPQIDEHTKTLLEELDIPGLGFEPYQKRYYPEASMAAHLVGFVGKDDQGQDTGYFGLEGALENELKARNTTKVIQADALGREFLEYFDPDLYSKDGRSIVTTIRRDVQHMITQELRKGVQTYGAASGEILIIEPDTGKVIAYSASNDYDPSDFIKYDPALYRNPGLTHAYEPGSTFKVLTMASGIDAGVISPQTQCPICDRAKTIGSFTIKTWDDKYRANTTMTEALINSDNIALIYTAELLGAERFQEYLKAFGISDAIGIEIQEDTTTPFPKTWRPVELATRSFGQGITTTSFQLVRAVSAIANKGIIMQPYIVDHVVDPFSETIIHTQPSQYSTPISAETAQIMTQMMIESAKKNSQRREIFKTITVAGKSGTSQIASQGRYVEGKTITSFVGFAPADNPQFVMLVKLHEPSTSPWSEGTATPLWLDVAEKLVLLL